MFCYRNFKLDSFDLYPKNGILYNNFRSKRCNKELEMGYGGINVPNLGRLVPLSMFDGIDKICGTTDEGVQRYRLLDGINSVDDLKKFSEESLPELCNEIRAYLGDVISKVGGHFSGSLGVIELTVALHYVFDSPFDKIVWDIGHQAYVHKILTGRKDKLHTIKKKDGLSGFCRLYESDHDAFGAGHSSTSISALQGILEGHRILNEFKTVDGKKRNYVCVIGDGGMTGGLAYEGLNYALNIKSPMIIIYNDNGQVSLPTGMNSVTGTRPILPFFLQNSTDKPIQPVEHCLTQLLNSSDSNSRFHSGDLNIIGPVDGHDINGLLHLFKLIKEGNRVGEDECLRIMGKRIDGPLIVHLKTVKGYCCPEALSQLDRMHAIKPNTKLTIINPDEQFEPLQTPKHGDPVDVFDEGTFSALFAKTMVKMARIDDKVLGVTAAMPGGTGIGEFGNYFPNRTFDVGISEQHAITFSAGLALSGAKPYCAIYSTFLQRALDQVIHDVAIQNIPIRLIVDRAGYVGEDGLSHHGNYDLNFLRPLKNMIISSPSNQIELTLTLLSSLNTSQPFVIRYPKSKVINKNRLIVEYGEEMYNRVKNFVTLENLANNLTEFWSFKSRVVRTGKDLVIFTLGPILYSVIDAIDGINRDEQVLDPTIIDVRFLNPFDSTTLNSVIKGHKKIITVEDSVNGGLGTTIIEQIQLVDSLQNFNIKCIKYPYKYIHHGSIEEQKREAQIDVNGIQKQIQSFIKS